jgi:hypothetical protein
MKRTILLALPLLLAANSGAFAASSGGNAALALAALIAEHSPAISHNERIVLGRFLEGHTGFALPPGMHHIVVSADKVVCRLSDIDVTMHNCDITVGSMTYTEAGRRGQALLATMQENGVTGDGAAGSIYFGVAPISCNIDTGMVQARAGGGAKCVFTVGP